ncbi:unnamed protein product [Ilex paraguariensis]|uniref:Uncharacterized protein n=1 Tax=Ilex paraguariensis TaxID=185542 RepID=A0ABC8SGA8_9AQUA
MRAASANTLSTSRTPLWRLNSPLPYLFISVALTLGFITIALIILVCSRYRNQSSNSWIHSEEKSETVKPKNTETDLTPNILVIMAGDENPTYLATPVSSSSTHCSVGRA